MNHLSLNTHKVPVVSNFFELFSPEVACSISALMDFVCISIYIKMHRVHINFWVKKIRWHRFIKTLCSAYTEFKKLNWTAFQQQIFLSENSVSEAIWKSAESYLYWFMHSFTRKGDGGKSAYFRFFCTYTQREKEHNFPFYQQKKE